MDVWEIVPVGEIGQSCAASDVVEFILGLASDLWVCDHEKEESYEGGPCLGSAMSARHHEERKTCRISPSCIDGASHALNVLNTFLGFRDAMGF